MLSISQLYAGLLPLISLVSCDFTSRQIGSWDRPRAALIRDHFYLEGGWMQTGSYKDGAWQVNTVKSSEGLLFKLSMNESFGISWDSPPAIFESINEGPVDNYYMDGFMFADYDEFYAYG
jgi:hypothetical protein